MHQGTINYSLVDESSSDTHSPYIISATRRRTNADLKQLLLDQMNLSPIQKYKKYDRFPYQILLTGLIILCASATVLTIGFERDSQRRQLQIFFNVQLLGHESFDIYQGSDVFTWRTHEFRTLPQIQQFFDNLFLTVLQYSEYNFFPVNETIADSARHIIRREFKDGTQAQQNLTINEILEYNFFSRDIKDYLNQVQRMTLVLQLFNLTKQLPQGQLHVQISLEHQFMMKVELELVYEKIPQATQLGIRKVPSEHHLTFNPPRLVILGSAILIILTMRNIYKRYTLYLQAPFPIEGISNGQSFDLLNFMSKLKILGVWNIAIVGLNIACMITSSGLSCFFSWLQPIRYLQFTENPLLFTNLAKRVFPVQLILFLNLFVVLPGFVFYSMLVFSQSNKFDTFKKSVFEYLFNNYQYGIYQNILTVVPYGYLSTTCYLSILFYMVFCVNNMIPSVLCNIVISKTRYKDLKEELKKLTFECPICGNCETREQTPQPPPSPGEENDLRKRSSEEFEIQILSPALSPFLEPGSRGKKLKKSPKQDPLSSQPKRRKNTFMIASDESLPIYKSSKNMPTSPLYRAQKGLKHRSDNFEVMSKKIQLGLRVFETAMLEIEVYKAKNNKAFLKWSLSRHLEKYQRLWVKMDRFRKQKYSSKNIPRSSTSIKF